MANDPLEKKTYKTRLEVLKAKVKLKKQYGGARPGAGRHTKYKKEYCELLIEHMSEGYSFTTFAAVIGVNPDTLQEWKKHKEWAEACEMAKNAGLMTWENIGIQCQRGLSKGSYSHWAIMGKNIYGVNISFDSDSAPPTSDGFIFVDGDENGS